jgi:hypothetical protein
MNYNWLSIRTHDFFNSNIILIIVIKIKKNFHSFLKELKWKVIANIKTLFLDDSSDEDGFVPAKMEIHQPNKTVY